MKEYGLEEYKKLVEQGLIDTPNIHSVYETIKETSSNSYQKKNTGKYLAKRRQEEDTLSGNERQSWVLFHDYLQRSINELIRKNYEKELQRLNIHKTWPRARTEGCAKVNIDVYIGINVNIRNITVCEFLADFLDYCDRHNVHHPVFDIDNINEPLEGWSVDEVLEQYRQSRLPSQKPYVARYALKELEVSPPYKGLSSFTVADSKFFFGRDEDIDKIRRKIEKRPFFAVLGSSGSGKSSVVHGGVIPSLLKSSQSSESDRRSGWSYITFKPSLSSQNPFLALADMLYPQIPSERFKDGDDKKAIVEGRLKNAAGAIAASKWLVDYLEDIQKHKNSSHLLLVIDQFEELFTPEYQGDRDDFIELLRVTADKLPDNLRIVITMRSDFLPRAETECGKFYNLIIDETNHHFLAVINGKDQFRDIITKPAKENGVEFQEEAVNAILDDLLRDGSQANILPLLEYALTEIWKHREGREITVQAVKKVGEILSFLPAKAEAFYQNDKYSDDDRKTILRIFLNLANFLEADADNRYSKRTLRWESQPSSPEATREWELVQTLAGDKDGYRFLNIAYDDSDKDKKRPHIEVVHDILLTAWKTLRNELDRNIPFFIWNAEIKSNANEWLENGKREKYLLSGASLVKAEEYLNSPRILDSGVIEFIEKSKKYHQRTERRIKLVRVASLSILTILLTLTTTTLTSLKFRTDEANINNKRLLAEVSASFLKDGEVRLAILTALESLDENTTPEIRDEISYQQAFSTLIGATGEYVEVQRHHIPGLNSSGRHVVTPDLEKIIFDSGSYYEGKTASVWSLSEGKKLFELEGIPRIVDKFQLSNSGQLVTLTSHDGVTGKTWDLESQRQILDFIKRDIREIYVTKDKKYYMSRDGNGYSSIGYIDDITQASRDIFSSGNDERIAISPDGCCFYHGNQNGLNVYNIDGFNHELDRVIKDPNNSTFTFSLDQRFVLAFGDDGKLRYNYISDFLASSNLIEVKNVPNIEFSKHRLLLSEDGAFFAFYERKAVWGDLSRNLLHVFHLPSGAYLGSYPDDYIDYTETLLDANMFSGKIMTAGSNYNRVISMNIFDIATKKALTFRAEQSESEGYSDVKFIPTSKEISAVNSNLSFLSIFSQIGFPELMQSIKGDAGMISAKFIDEKLIEVKYSYEVEESNIIKINYWDYKSNNFLNYNTINNKRQIFEDIFTSDFTGLNDPNCSLFLNTNLLCNAIESSDGKYKLSIPYFYENRDVILTDVETDESVTLFEINDSTRSVYGKFSLKHGKVVTYFNRTFTVWDAETGNRNQEWNFNNESDDEFLLFDIAHVAYQSDRSGYVAFRTSELLNITSNSISFYDIFTGNFIRDFEFTEKSQIFYHDDSDYFSLVLNDKEIYLKEITTGKTIFKFINASSKVIDVDFNASSNSILWTQETGEVFVVRINSWSEERLINAFRQLTIRPLTNNERREFNLN